MKENEYNNLFVNTYKRSGPPMSGGAGVHIFDSKGKKYLDFGSGIAVNALGHSHPLLIETLQHQAALLIHTSNLYHTQPQIDLASKLIEKSFADKVFFCNSGTEAIEAAIKFSRKWAKKIDEEKYHILSFTNSFHGRTYGALSATAQESFHSGFEPIVQGFHYAPFNDSEATKRKLDSHKFAAIIVEPLQGEGGINKADTEFLKFLREYANKNSIALVFDEIQCGTGRTGTLWNYEQHNVIPDIMALAKPLGGGLPLGAVICTDDIASAITPGNHGTTFGGNPLACALGAQIIDIVSEPVFLKKVQENGKYLADKLSEAAKDYDIIEGVRGEGLLLGVRFTENPDQVIDDCKRDGLLLVKANNNTIRFMPPLTVTSEHIDEAFDIFSKAVAALNIKIACR
ncbi:Acetylornithine aminotransferase [Chitinispirillum alkaliphilum]|nr:Acetylornithine aminotransferase [Chitinispirillum alkaliphilum]